MTWKPFTGAASGNLRLQDMHIIFTSNHPLLLPFYIRSIASAFTLMTTSTLASSFLFLRLIYTFFAPQRLFFFSFLGVRLLLVIDICIGLFIWVPNSTTGEMFFKPSEFEGSLLDIGKWALKIYSYRLCPSFLLGACTARTRFPRKVRVNSKSSLSTCVL
jgi:hypothetical protein